jgi:hypothetical protein
LAGLFIASGAANVAVHEGVSLLRLSDASATRLRVWLPPALNLLLLLGMRRKLLSFLGLRA